MVNVLRTVLLRIASYRVSMIRAKHSSLMIGADPGEGYKRSVFETLRDVKFVSEHFVLFWGIYLVVKT